MARTVSVAQLIIDSRRLADLENALDRFPDSEVINYINKGVAYLYRKMITVSDQPFFMKQAPDIILQRGVSVYPVPQDFLRVLSVHWASNPTGPWRPMEPFAESELWMLMDAGYFGGVLPRAYRIYGDGATGAFTQGTIPTAYSIQILPAPSSGIARLRYVPTCPVLQNTTDLLDGILGFEDAVSTWAAVLMRRKDDLDTADLERDFGRIMDEVGKIARHRDGSRPPKVSLVRGRGGYRGGRFGGRW